MRISRERSGNAAGREDKVNRGAGEYEWAGLEPSDPTKGELLNKRVMLRLADDILLDTACVFDYQGDKWRTRTADDARAPRYIYPIYHIAVALLMPQPTREHGNLGRGLPVLRREEYFLEDIISRRVSVMPNDTADFEVGTLRVSNYTIPDGEDIDVATRFDQVRSIWEARGLLPEELAELMQEHESLVRGGDQISIAGVPLMGKIQRATVEASREASVGAATVRLDPLPTLLELIGIPPVESELPPLEEIAPDDPEIRLREVARRRRLASTRSAAAVRFRKQVREAYRSTCLVCGLKLPQVWEGGQAGVDSAHILPDSSHDMNEVANGVCLCKLHHWAFDEGLIEIRCDDSGYSVAIPDEAVARAASVSLDLAFLRAHAGPIPSSRLPIRVANRPSRECLSNLRDLLYPC